MANKAHDALAFIGRLSPLTLAHEETIRHALTLTERVVVLVGSAFEPRNIRNPWTFKERMFMIQAAFPEETLDGRVKVVPLPDYPYNDQKWKASVRAAVMSKVPWSDFPPKISLIGHSKDASSYYLNMFPDWGSVNMANIDGINATDVREDYFEWLQPEPFGYSRPIPTWVDKVSPAVRKFMEENPLPKTLRTERDLICRYKLAWSDAPFPPTFNTTDTIVVQSGHILLVKRKASPGIGLWALPGGFLNSDETLLTGAIRELKEETKIDVPIRTLTRLAKDNSHTFDHPFRSTRGRTITQAFFIDLGDAKKLPKITAADDAEKAVWVPFDQVKREKMFEDHFHIIDFFTNIG